MKKNTFLLFLFCLAGFFILFQYSCIKDKGPLTVAVSQSYCDSVNTKFSSVQLPMLQTYCAISGCHDGTGSLGNYNLYADVKVVADNGQLRNRAITLKNMPPSGPLPNSSIQKLNCWLNKGAKNN